MQSAPVPAAVSNACAAKGCGEIEGDLCIGVGDMQIIW